MINHPSKLVPDKRKDKVMSNDGSTGNMHDVGPPEDDVFDPKRINWRKSADAVDYRWQALPQDICASNARCAGGETPLRYERESFFWEYYNKRRFLLGEGAALLYLEELRAELRAEEATLRRKRFIAVVNPIGLSIISGISSAIATLEWIGRFG